MLPAESPMRSNVWSSGPARALESGPWTRARHAHASSQPARRFGNSTRLSVCVYMYAVVCNYILTITTCKQWQFLDPVQVPSVFGRRSLYCLDVFEELIWLFGPLKLHQSYVFEELMGKGTATLFNPGYLAYIYCAGSERGRCDRDSDIVRNSDIVRAIPCD